jgi:hypothetical protein
MRQKNRIPAPTMSAIRRKITLTPGKEKSNHNKNKWPPATSLIDNKAGLLIIASS